MMKKKFKCKKKKFKPLDRATRIVYKPIEKKFKTLDIPVRLFSKEGLDIRSMLLKSDFKLDVNDTGDYSIDILEAMCHNVVDLIIKGQYNSIYKNKRISFISSAELRRIKRYPNDLLFFLYENGVIRSNNQYFPGSRSMGYCLTPYYDRRKTVPIECYYKPVSRRIDQERKSDHPISRYYNSLLQVRLSETSISDLIRTSVSRKALKYSYKKGTDHEKQKRKLKSYQDRVTAQIQRSIIRINYNRHAYSVAHCGRHYNTLTNCKAELRRYLTYDGEPLHEIDLRNASAYLITGIHKRPEDFVNCILEADSKLERSVLKSKIKGISKEEWDSYSANACNGKFYEYMQDKVDGNLSRKQAKNQFYLYLYHKNKKGSKLKNAFKEFWPNIADLFEYVKSNFAKTKNEGRTNVETGNALCHAIYRLESDLVVNNIAKTFMKKYPSIPIYTIHDSFLTTDEGLSLLKPLIESISIEMFGTPAATSITRSKLPSQASNKPNNSSTEAPALPMPTNRSNKAK